MESMKTLYKQGQKAVMVSRPPPLPNLMMGSEDLVNVFGSQNFTNLRKSSPRKLNFSRSHSRMRSSYGSDEESGESGDELDCFSVHGSQASPTPKTKSSSKKKYVDPTGKEHDYHLGHLSTKEKDMQNLKFKTISQTHIEPSVTRFAKENKYSSPISSPPQPSRPISDETPNYDATPRPQSPHPTAEILTHPKPRPSFKKQKPTPAKFFSPKKHSWDSSSSGDERHFEKRQAEMQAYQKVRKRKAKNDVTQKHLKIKPFPMDLTQRPNASPSVSPTKRSLSDFEDAGSTRKRKQASDFIKSITMKDNANLFLDPDVDPDTLCPFCDEQLPKNPTASFKNLLQAVRNKSVRESRPTNPQGLRAPIGIFAELCQRHHFESKLLPLAEQKGWPQLIKWDELEKRIQNMESYLRLLITDSGSGAMMKDSEIEFPSEDVGPRSKSYFWLEAMKDVKQKGLNVIAGVRGQYHTFEKIQPGYYGEKGSIIIHQALYILFPPSSLNPTLLKPFSPAEFIQRVLVPEVALRLIMDDRNLCWPDDIEEGIAVMRESTAYGLGMFREDDAEVAAGSRKGKKGMSAADQMMINTAQRRQKELGKEGEESEIEDQEMDDRDVYVQLAKKKRRKVPKAADLTDINVSPMPQHRPPRPKPIFMFNSSARKGGTLTGVDRVSINSASSSQMTTNLSPQDAKVPNDVAFSIKKPSAADGNTPPRPKPTFKSRTTTDKNTFGGGSVNDSFIASVLPRVYETGSTLPVSADNDGNEDNKF